MKRVEEIKKGLECCAAQRDGRCEEYDECACCPYFAANPSDEDILALIQRLEDHTREVTKLVPKWISVKERLPEMDTRVAVLYRFPRSETLFSSVLDYYAADPEPHFQHTLGEGGPIVCYWMPLPSAPEVWT